MKPKIRLAAIVAAALLFVLGVTFRGVAHAQVVCPGINFTQQAFAFEQVTVSTSPIGFTATKYAPSPNPTASPSFVQPAAAVAIFTVEKNPIRYTDDGLTVVTATVGQYIPTLMSYSVCGLNSIKQFSMIQDTSAAGSATVDVHYYRGATP